MTTANPEFDGLRPRAECKAHRNTGAQAAEWIGCHQKGVWRYLRFLGCSPQLAEDVVQEAFLAALEKDLVDIGFEACAAWLRTTARNFYFMHLRSQNRCPLRSEGLQMEAYWSEVVGENQGDDYLEALELCLDGLDPVHRSVLSMRYADGASREQMAHELGMGTPGVKALLRRLRARLKLCIEVRLRTEVNQ